ncbi:MAG: hypothetical protein FWE92_00415 [Defluviitaleaceae bacterium]|nr:hypothetical protein [Defluviitaleaceae bacterium]
MRSILEEFAHGNIPSEAPLDSRYRQALRAVCDNQEKLSSKLTDEEKFDLEKFNDAHSELNRLTAVMNFTYGYKLGLLMTAEAFITCNELFGEE